MLLSLFQLLEAAHIPWLKAPSSIVKVSNTASLLCCHFSFSDSLLLPPSSTCKDPCDYLGPRQIALHDLPILGSMDQQLWFHLQLNSPLLHKVTHSFWSLDRDIMGILSCYHTSQKHYSTYGTTIIITPTLQIRHREVM